MSAPFTPEQEARLREIVPSLDDPELHALVRRIVAAMFISFNQQLSRERLASVETAAAWAEELSKDA